MDRLASRIRGSSSGVEHHVANVVVVGSNPISRSCAIAILGWPLSLERVGCVMADQAIPARCDPRESRR